VSTTHGAILRGVSLILPLLLVFSTQQEQSIFERVPEMARHEGVDYGVGAAVDVGHEEESDAEGPEDALVEIVDDAEGDEQIVDGDGAPADQEQDHHGSQHLHNLGTQSRHG